MIRVGVVGLGYWGARVLRNFAELPECEVTAICDARSDRLSAARNKYPQALATNDYDQIFDGDLIDAVVLCTPTRTHYSLAKRALQAGLHTFVEKPLTTSSEEGQALIELAEERERVLFVGHVFLYSAPVIKLKELVDSGELGELCYISSTRLNLGPVRHDVNVLWDLAPHDVSIMLYLMGSTPESVSCSGLVHLKDGVHDVCSLTLHFDEQRMGLIHVSWLDPLKRRLMTVVGTKSMVAYDDIETLEKIKVYDTGVEVPSYSDSFGEFPYSYRHGDTFSPRLDEVEPLKAECRSFLRSISEGTPPPTDGHNGLDVVKIIEAANLSLNNGNGRIPVERNGHDFDLHGIEREAAAGKSLPPVEASR